MSKVLGEYKGEMPLSTVTNNRGKTGGVTPEIVALKGKRLAVMQEPRKGDILNEGILKELTGHDSVQARGLFQSPVTFVPQFTLVVCANVLPEIKSNDYGTWRRIRVVPFKALFTENPVQGDPNKPYQFQLDPTINSKFDNWKSVFLAMLVDKVLETEGKVPDCETVMKASNDYKNKQDVLSQFIEDKITSDPGGCLKPTMVSEQFRSWYTNNIGAKPPAMADLKAKMNEVFGEIDKSKGGWKDIKLVYDNQPGATTVDDADAD
jgi:P4 family phage/plasmid primase-like protien